MTFRTLSDALIDIPLSAGGYISLILGSALCGSAAFLCWAERERKSQPSQPRTRAGDPGVDPGVNPHSSVQQREYHGLGLSGVCMGLTPFTSLLMPIAKVKVIGAVDMPLWLVSAAYFLFDSANLDNKDSQIGHAAHIGGAILERPIICTRTKSSLRWRRYRGEDSAVMVVRGSRLFIES
jgi:membrane associated rhomboid family serine protease